MGKLQIKNSINTLWSTSPGKNRNGIKPRSNDGILNTVGSTAPKGGDGNHGHYTDDDTQSGQGCSQFAVGKILQGEFEILIESHSSILPSRMRMHRGEKDPISGS